MNEELQKQILELIKGGKDFVLAQAPDTIRQFVAMEAWGYLWVTIACGLAAFFFLSLFIIGLKIKNEETSFTFCIVGAVLGTAFSIAVFCNFDGYYKLSHFPKGYLFYLATHHGNGCGF